MNKIKVKMYVNNTTNGFTIVDENSNTVATNEEVGYAGYIKEIEGVERVHVLLPYAEHHTQKIQLRDDGFCYLEQLEASTEFKKVNGKLTLLLY
jgi:hypothetical protein